MAHGRSARWVRCVGSPLIGLAARPMAICPISLGWPVLNVVRLLLRWQQQLSLRPPVNLFGNLMRWPGLGGSNPSRVFGLVILFARLLNGSERQKLA
jgi:hypothetical protein